VALGLAPYPFSAVASFFRERALAALRSRRILLQDISVLADPACGGFWRPWTPSTPRGRTGIAARALCAVPPNTVPVTCFVVFLYDLACPAFLS